MKARGFYAIAIACIAACGTLQSVRAEDPPANQTNQQQDRPTNRQNEFQNNQDPNNPNNRNQNYNQNQNQNQNQFGQNDRFNRGGMHKSMPAGEVRQLVDQSKKPLADLISAAERKTGGKAVCASIVEFSKVRDGAMKYATTGDFNQDELNKADTTKPVALVTCVTNDKVTECVVCAETGKIIAHTEHALYTPGKSAFHSSQRGHNRYTMWNEWNQAPRRTQRITDLMKKPVHSQASDEHIGEIKDFVIDPDGGRILYQVVEFYGKMGHGNRWYAIPLSVAKLSEDYKSIDMNYTSAQVNKANGFDRANWPNLTDEQFALGIYNAYGEQPYWQDGGRRGMARTSRDTGEGRVIRASERDNNNRLSGRMNNPAFQMPQRWQKASDMVGKDVRNPNTNEDLGTLKDVVVDPDTGRILYGVLSFGGFLGLGDKLFAIPWSSLELASDAKAVNLTIDKERLKNAEGFDESNWPNMADQQWATRTYDFYGQPRYWERNRGLRGDNNLDDMNDEFDDNIDDNIDDANDDINNQDNNDRTTDDANRTGSPNNP